MITVSRECTSDVELDSFKIDPPKITFKEKTINAIRKSVPSDGPQCFQFVYKFLPVINRFKKYKLRSYLKGDIISGLTIGIMQIPQGLAYAGLATLDPVAGLYTMFIPPLIYFIFGSSNYMHFGTVAINSLLMANSVTPSVLSSYASNRTITVNGIMIPMPENVARQILTCNITLFVGIIQFGLLITISEFVSRLLSPTMISGFTFGAALQALMSQLLPVLGISIPKTYFKGKVGLTVQRFIYIVTHLKSVNVASLLISIFSIAFLLACMFTREKVKKISPVPVPGELVLIIILTGISYGFNFNKRFGVPIVGFFPKGLPKLVVPDLSALSLTIQSSLIIGFVSFVTVMSMGKALSQIYVDTFRGSQDLFTIGLANVVGSFFGCLPPGASLSRSILHGTLGNTQFYSIFSSICVLIVLLAAAPLLYSTPKALLGSIVVVALVPVYMQVKTLKILVKRFRWEAVVWLATALTGIFVSTEYSVAVGFAANILVILFNLMMPKFHVLGQIINTEIYRDTKIYNVQENDNYCIALFDKAIIYVNRTQFETELLSLLKKMAPKKEMEDCEDNNLRVDVELQRITTPRQKCVIIDVSKVSYIDSSGLRTILEMLTKFSLNDVKLYFAGANELMRKLISEDTENTIFFPTIYDAVSYCQSS